MSSRHRATILVGLLWIGTVQLGLTVAGAQEAAERPAIPEAVEPTRVPDGTVPRLIRFSGVVQVSDSEGKPRTGLVGVTFALYTEQEGGAPQWLETQNVSVDEQGRYTVLLGSSQAEGLPLELFTAGEARWLGVSVEGGEEQARVLLVSVPYAMKAADADTVGGLPPSAFLRAAPVSGGTDASGTGASATTPKGTGAKGAAAPSSVTTSTAGYIPKFTDDAGTETDSQIYDSGTGIGIGTITPGSLLDLSAPLPVLRLSSTDATQAEQIRFYDGATLGGFFQYYNASSSVNPKVFQIGGYVAGSQLGFLSAGLERVRVAANGNVGIGTTVPASLLELRAPSPVLRLSSTNATQGEQISFLDGLTLGGFLRYNNASSAVPKLFQVGGYVAGSQLGFLSAGLERMRVNALGNVGIGTTIPSQKLEVAGNVKVTGASGYFFPDASNQIKAALTDVSGGGLQVAIGAGIRTLSLLSSCATGQLLKWPGVVLRQQHHHDCFRDPNPRWYR